MCPSMSVCPCAPSVMCSTNVSRPLCPLRARPLKTSSMRPEPALVAGSRVPVKVQVVEPFQVPVQSLVPVHFVAPVAGSNEMTCCTHAPTGSDQVPLTFQDP